MEGSRTLSLCAESGDTSLGGQQKEAGVGEPQGKHHSRAGGGRRGCPLHPAPHIHDPRASPSAELRALMFANIDFPLWTLQH